MAKKKTLVRKTGSGTGYVPGSINAAGNASPYAGQGIAVGATGDYGKPTGDTTFTDPYSIAKGQLDAALQPTRDAAGKAYGNMLGYSIADEGTAANDYGATLAARDPNADPGTATGYSFDWNNVDSTNPFSKAALLVRSYKQQQGRTTNGLAAQGQLYSGAMLNQQNTDQFGFQQGQDALQKGLSSYLTGQSRARTDAGVTRDSTINGATLAGLQSLLGS